MAVRTITIDEEAYEILQRLRAQDESFSTVIKRTFRSHTPKHTFEQYVQETDVAPELLDALEDAVRRSRQSLLREVDL